MTAADLAAGALRVRALALELLAAEGEPSETVLEAAAAVSRPAWEVFLRAERCGAPLGAALEGGGAGVRLPDEIRGLVQERRRFETVRALRARAQLDEVGQAAGAHGWRVIVLKGGRALLRSRQLVLDLVDVDLLATGHTVAALTAWLDAHGDGASAYSSPTHVPARLVHGGLPVEVHHTVDVPDLPESGDLWDRAVPVGAGLEGLAPADHVRHLLHHTTVSHLSRRGRLRDVLLLADALGEMSADDLTALRRRAAEGQWGTVRVALLDMALAYRDGGAVTDRFASEAFTRYATFTVMRRVRRGLPEAQRVVEWVFAHRAGRDERRALWRRALRRSSAPSPHRVIASVERVAPRLGWIWRRAVRLAHGAVSSAVAWPIAWWIGGRWRRLRLP